MAIKGILVSLQCTRIKALTGARRAQRHCLPSGPRCIRDIHIVHLESRAGNEERGGGIVGSRGRGVGVVGHERGVAGGVEGRVGGPFDGDAGFGDGEFFGIGSRVDHDCVARGGGVVSCCDGAVGFAGADIECRCSGEGRQGKARENT